MSASPDNLREMPLQIENRAVRTEDSRTARARILAVDDTQTNLLVLKRMLTIRGYDIRLAASGEEALVSLSDAIPDLILLDIRMPVMDGFAVCRCLKESSRYADIPIIFISALDDIEDKIQAFAVGGSDYITKPFQFEEVAARVELHLKLNRMQRQLEIQRHGLETVVADLRSSRIAVEESETRFRTLVTAVPDIFFRLDREGRFLDYKARQEDLLLPPQTFLNKKFQEVLPPVIANMLENAVGMLTPENRMVTIEYSLEMPDRGECRYECRISLSNLDQVMVVIRDISEQYQLWERIQRGQKEWQSTFNSVSDMILMVNADGQIQRCNQACEHHLHLPLEKIAGSYLADLIPELKELDGQKNYISNIHIPGTPAIFELSASPYLLEQFLGTRVIILKDVTSQKVMEENLVTAQKMASLGTLAAGVAHEINTPLQVITGIADGLILRGEQNTLDDVRFRRGMEMISQNGWRMAEIIRSLLTYARSTKETMEAQNLNKIIHDALMLAKYKKNDWKDIKIHLILDDHLPDLVCDASQMTQALLNLISNSTDAMPDGGELFIRTYVQTGNRQIVLEVEDTGTGISPQILPRIFDPFFTTKEVGQGTGLGLSIVMGIIRAHNGEIKVDSHPGLGTKMVLVFPQK